MDMFSLTRFCLRVLAVLNEIIRRMKRNVILTIAIVSKTFRYLRGFRCAVSVGNAVSPDWLFLFFQNCPSIF